MSRSLKVTISIPILIFLISFLVYFQTAARQPINYADSTELMTAAYVNGIAHPPSYPLYTLFLHYLMVLSPLKEKAFLPNLSSAFFQSMSLVFLYLACLELLSIVNKKVSSSHKGISLLCVFILGFSSLFWLHALVTEVFALNNFYIALILWLSFRWYRQLLQTKSIKWNTIYIASLVFGLGASHHQTILFLFPGWIAFIYLATKKYIFSRPKIILLNSLIGTAFFALSYSLLWFQYSQNASFSWYFRPTLGGLWDVITRNIYSIDGSAIETYTQELNLHHSLVSIWHYCLFLCNHFTIPAFLIGCFGFWKLCKQKKPLWLLINLSFIISGPVLAAYLKFPQAFNISDTGYYWGTSLRLRIFLVNELLFIFLLLFGLNAIVSKITNLIPFQRHKNPFFIIGFILIIPLYLLINNFPKLDMSKANFDMVFNRQILEVIPSKSILLVDSDGVFGLLYQQLVEKIREDITIYPATPEMRWYFLKDKQSPCLAVTCNVRIQRLSSLIAWNLYQGKRVFLLEPNPQLLEFLGVDANPFYAIPYGYTLEITRTPKEVDDYNYGLSKQLANISFPSDNFWDKGVQGNLSVIHTLLGFYLGQNNTLDAANQHFTLAYELAQLPDNKRKIEQLQTNLKLNPYPYLKIQPKTVSDYLEESRKSLWQGNKEATCFYLFKALMLEPQNFEAKTVQSQLCSN